MASSSLNAQPLGHGDHAQLSGSANVNHGETVDVLIVGAGPVGLVLANLLGQHGVRTLVLERNARVETEPRAVTLDDESLRVVQASGLVQEVLSNVVLGYGVQYYDWRGRPFASIQPTRQEYGYPKRNAFRQPALVEALHQGLSRFEHVRVLFEHEIVSLKQAADGVTCVAAQGLQLKEFRAAYVVGCDGGRSRVREICNVVLDGSTYPERWLIVDLAQRTTPFRHTRTYCDPARPAIRLPGPHGSLRYEFMLRSGDRDEEVLDEQTFRGWIAARTPEDADLPLVRKAVYGFHARVATRWKLGRVMLAGDAAHLTPPFAGQGLNSGIRDAANLAWKLAAVVKWSARPDLLDTYETERRHHAAALIRMALRIGAFMQPKSTLAAALSQVALRAACLIPWCRDYILQLRFKPKPRLVRGFFQGTPARPHSDLFPQPTVQQADGGFTLLDDMLGQGFAVIGWDGPEFRSSAERFAPAGMPHIVVALLRAEDDFLADVGADPVLRARDANGELARLLTESESVAVVLRPDRYVYRWISTLSAPL